MKRACVVISLVIIAVTLALGQVKRKNSVEAEIIALEKRAFEAWKNKDKKAFQEGMLEDSLSIYSSGAVTKEQWIQMSIDPNCTVKSYSLDNIKVTMLSSAIALMTYRFTQDTVCNGKQEPSPVWASTVFVKRGKKWLGAFHQETPADQAK
ncbi:MAG: nuclear transport factor 2 family protein [Acidobacteria bacterium]|nr:nuclear transport factor 2 family protein [Acidobacteriota bacterium]